MFVNPAVRILPAGGIWLETVNLVLRPWGDLDRAPMAVIQGDPHVRRFFARPLTREEIDADIDNAITKAAENGFHTQAAEFKATGELVGIIGVNVIPDVIRAAIPSRPLVEVGWVLAQRFWGRGLAAEGASAWIEYAWAVGVDEVIATTSVLNTPSRRVMEKLGPRYYPADYYERPTISAVNPLRPHLVYRVANPKWMAT